MRSEGILPTASRVLLCLAVLVGCLFVSSLPVLAGSYTTCRDKTKQGEDLWDRAYRNSSAAIAAQAASVLQQAAEACLACEVEQWEASAAIGRRPEAGGFAAEAASNQEWIEDLIRGIGQWSFTSCTSRRSNLTWLDGFIERLRRHERIVGTSIRVDYEFTRKLLERFYTERGCNGSPPSPGTPVSELPEERPQGGETQTTYGGWVLPTAVGNLYASNTHSHVISLGWGGGRTSRSNPAGSAQIEVYRARSRSGTYVRVARVPRGAVGAWSDERLSQGESYWYKVRACNDAGCTRFSEPAAGSTISGPPAAPQRLFVSQGLLNGGILISWDGRLGESYEVYRAASRYGTYSLLQRVSRGSKLTDTVSSKSSFWYKVRAYNDAGCGSSSEPVRGWAKGGSATPEPVSSPTGGQPVVPPVSSTKRLDSPATTYGLARRTSNAHARSLPQVSWSGRDCLSGELCRCNCRNVDSESFSYGANADRGRQIARTHSAPRRHCICGYSQQDFLGFPARCLDISRLLAAASQLLPAFWGPIPS